MQHEFTHTNKYTQWERKWLMHQLKYEFSEEEREDLFLTWNIHRESKERKGQLLRKVRWLCGCVVVCADMRWYVFVYIGNVLVCGCIC